MYITFHNNTNVYNSLKLDMSSRLCDEVWLK